MTKELVEVVQADIDAAKNYWAGWSNNEPRNPDGSYHPLVLLIASTRLSAEAAIVAWLREESAKAETEGRSIALWEAADTLEQGKIRHG